jgi:hypothetical protein
VDDVQITTRISWILPASILVPLVFRGRFVADGAGSHLVGKISPPRWLLIFLAAWGLAVYTSVAASGLWGPGLLFFPLEYAVVLANVYWSSRMWAGIDGRLNRILDVDKADRP